MLCVSSKKYDRHGGTAMLKIGEFSKLSRVSVRMLRHYDEVGLLAPSEVDPMTGYRYYSERQLITAGRIAALRALGFGLSADDQSRERAQRALNEFLRPEFLNRIDEIVYFNHLTEENFRAIAALMLDEVRAAMAERGMTLHWTPAVIDYLVRKGYSETYGARNLRRTIQRDVEDAIASAVVAQRKAAGDVAIDAQNDRIVVTIDGKEVTA